MRWSHLPSRIRQRLNGFAFALFPSRVGRDATHQKASIAHKDLIVLYAVRESGERSGIKCLCVKAR